MAFEQGWLAPTTSVLYDILWTPVESIWVSAFLGRAIALVLPFLSRSLHEMT